MNMMGTKPISDGFFVKQSTLRHNYRNIDIII